MEAPKKIGVAIIGAGTMARNHIVAYQACETARLDAICDLDANRSAAVARKYGIPWSGSNLAELLCRPEIQAVSVVTPAAAHEEIVCKALAAGKHVLCEKPPALSATQAQVMERASLAAGRVLMYGFVRRFAGNTAYLRQRIRSGAFGNIYYARAGILRRCGHPGGWYADRASAGGGALMDIGVHMLDLSLYLMGDAVPAEVYACLGANMGTREHVRSHRDYHPVDSRTGSVSTEDFAAMLIRTADGRSLLIESSWTMHRKEDHIFCEIFGTKMGACLEPELELYTDYEGILENVQPLVPDGGFYMETALREEVAHFLECAAGCTECVCPAQDGTRVMRILEAAYRSAESGHSEKVV